MEWLTTETEYEGLPLYLRFPNYKRIWNYKAQYPKLVCITHTLDEVKNNGLPTSEYNLSLIDFDGEVVDLFQSETNGIIFLVETYGGSRNYWFYALDSDIYNKLFDNLKEKNPEKNMTLSARNDNEWGFLKEYPIELYKPE